jgi:hypothetical protein
MPEVDYSEQVPAGPPRRLGRRPLTSHIPIRFRPDVIAEVKKYADEDRKSVSSWIRDLVEREVERRRLLKGSITHGLEWPNELSFDLDQAPRSTSTAPLLIPAA